MKTRILIMVHASLFPSRPDDEWTRTYIVSAAEWAAAKAEGDYGQRDLLAGVVKKAQDYAFTLMMRPDKFNWVRVEQVYF